MNMEFLQKMNEGIYPGLLTMMEAIALITLFFAIAALLISLASIAWLCFKETPQGEHHRLTPVLKANELYPPALTTPGVNPSGRLLVGASQTSGRTNFNSAS